MKRTLALALVLGLSVCLGSSLAAPVPAPRPAIWASPVLDIGVQNLYKIESDFYRSARPDSSGFQKLAAMGIKTVLDVEGGDGDARAVNGTLLKVFHVPMNAWGLRDDRVLQALRILTDPKNRPVLIHCHLGADRTGAIVALYRVVVQGWSKEDAVREMNEGGFHHSSLWRNLDEYVLKANAQALRKQLGIVLVATSPTGPAVIAGKPSSAGLAIAPAESQPSSSISSPSNNQ